MLTVTVYDLDDSAEDRKVGVLRLDGKKVTTDPPDQQTLKTIASEPVFVKGKVLTPDKNVDEWFNSLYLQYKSAYLRVSKPRSDDEQSNVRGPAKKNLRYITQKGWITIGGSPCPPGKEHCEGTHVYIDDDGEVTAGPSDLVGKPVNNLSGKKKPDKKKPDKKKPQEDGPRSALTGQDEDHPWTSPDDASPWAPKEDTPWASPDDASPWEPKRGEEEPTEEPEEEPTEELSDGPESALEDKPEPEEQSEEEQVEEQPLEEVGDENATDATPETTPDGQPGEQPGERPGSTTTDTEVTDTSGQVEGETGGPGDATDGEVGEDTGQPAGVQPVERIPAEVEEVNRRLDRFEKVFRNAGRNEQADWMNQLKDHINSVGVESALESLGAKQEGQGENVQYAGSMDVSEFAEEYLARNGISLVGGSIPQGDVRAISTTSSSSDESGVHSRGESRDFFPSLQTLRDKLDEAQHLPGLEKSEDLSKLMGGEFGAEVQSFNPQVLQKLNETYGEGKWIVKTYSDDAYAGFGIFFPQRVQQLQKDAQSTIWNSGAELAKYGFKHLRDEQGKVVGILHEGGDKYLFGTDQYNNVINGEVRKWGDAAEEVADDEQGASLPRGREGNPVRYMAQPAFPVVGISNEERAAGVTFKRGQEGRVHVVTRNGKAELIPHATWLKEEPLPVVFEDDDTRAMAQAAVDAINALPESERGGQLYAPDVVKTADGYRVVEANPANEAGASGYLQDNPMVIDSYVSHMTGREPGHVKFIRDLLTKKKRPAPQKYLLRSVRRKGQPPAQKQPRTISSKPKGPKPAL